MSILRSTVFALALGLPGAAQAMGCEDIMKMLSYNVPVGTIVGSIKAGGATTQAEVQCLQQRGAPPEVVSAASAMAGGTSAPAPAPVAA
ncbi:MAG: hypothetical protein H0V89_01515, partial [Deltaproteobacteria bacterium]|nr:hypothetical protein [Deltaproteobacteria bacterium]